MGRLTLQQLRASRASNCAHHARKADDARNQPERQDQRPDVHAAAPGADARYSAYARYSA